MNVLGFTGLLALGAFLAGFLGALTGLGGGVVIVPMLVVLFGVDVRYAIGASLVSVIATSCGAAASYIKEGFANVRVAVLLEVATTAGGLLGAFLVVVYEPTHALLVIFGVVLVVSAVLASRRRQKPPPDEPPDPLATRLRLDGSFPGPGGPKYYFLRRIPLGFAVMFVAGVLSGLLGIGSGALKVLAMDQAMRMPFKVSTTTSNFMIGVTAAASAGVYLSQGYIEPMLALPVVLGVLLGSVLGARALMVVDGRILRVVFAVVLIAMAAQMIYRGFTGGGR